MEQFRTDNTEGYTQEQLDAMNDCYDSGISFCEFDSADQPEEFGDYNDALCERIFREMNNGTF